MTRYRPPITDPLDLLPSLFIPTGWYDDCLVVIATAPVIYNHLFTCLFILKMTPQKSWPLVTLVNVLVPGEDRQAVGERLGDKLDNPFCRNYGAILNQHLSYLLEQS